MSIMPITIPNTNENFFLINKFFEFRMITIHNTHTQCSKNVNIVYWAMVWYPYTIRKFNCGYVFCVWVYAQNTQNWIWHSKFFVLILNTYWYSIRIDTPYSILEKCVFYVLCMGIIPIPMPNTQYIIHTFFEYWVWVSIRIETNIQIFEYQIRVCFVFFVWIYTQTQYTVQYTKTYF